MGDEFDDFEMDALIEEDDAMMGGGDADEEEAMFELEEASERAGVDATRMESKVVPRLFFAGELLNVDGVTGGHNFQSCWTTGFVAGSSAAATAGEDGAP